MHFLTLIQNQFVVAVASAMYWVYNQLHYIYTFSSNTNTHKLANERRINENSNIFYWKNKQTKIHWNSQRVCLLNKTVWQVKCIGMTEKAIVCWLMITTVQWHNQYTTHSCSFHWSFGLQQNEFNNIIQHTFLLWRQQTKKRNQKWLKLTI